MERIARTAADGSAPGVEPPKPCGDLSGDGDPLSWLWEEADQFWLPESPGGECMRKSHNPLLWQPPVQQKR